MQSPVKHSLSDVVKRFEAFAIEERRRYEDDDDNKVGMSLSQMGRYLRFAAIAESRYRSSSRRFIEDTNARLKNTPPGVTELSAEQIAEHELSAAQGLELHYDIECFVIMTKVLLDKVAHFIEDFFGKARAASLHSHHKLCLNLAQYGAEKMLVLPDEMSQLAQMLQDIVVEYRDKNITHFKNPRAAHATLFSANGEVQIATIMIYPSSRDRQSTSPTIADVVEMVDKYLGHVFDLVDRHRVSSRYKLK